MRLIDADDCKDLMYVMCAGQDKAFVKAMEQVIDDCPTVQPEVRRGKWKPYQTPLDTRQTGWICTNCSCVNYDLSNGDTDFCPRCGCKMSEDK